MARLLICSVWNSRLRLSLFSLLLALLNILVLLVDDLPQLNTVETFRDDIDYVLETFQYMNDLQYGKAAVRSVFEKVFFLILILLFLLLL